MGIVWPAGTEIVVDAIRNVIGRNIDFVIVVSSWGCPVCDLDPITNKSDDSFCTICSGEYWLHEYDEIPIMAHLTWGPSEMASWQGGGILYEGQASAQIKYTNENVVLADTAVYVIADGKRMEVKKKVLRGVQPLNRMILTLQESDKDNV